MQLKPRVTLLKRPLQNKGAQEIIPDLKLPLIVLMLKC